MRIVEEEVLPDNFVITGCSRRNPGAKVWRNSLGDYPKEFLHHLDYISADLDNVDTLSHLPDYLHDNTYFLCAARKIIQMLLQTLKNQVFSMIPTTPEWLSKTLWARL